MPTLRAASSLKATTPIIASARASTLWPFAAAALTALASVVGPVPAHADPDLPYGPDTCVQGLVWRNARDGDTVCVRPQDRDRTAQENATAADRVDPNGAYGPLSCKSGFVWREAFDGDTVCVTPDRRSQAKADNAAAASRRATPGPGSNGCTVNDGKADTGVSEGGSPERFRAVDSPTLGAR